MGLPQATVTLTFLVTDLEASTRQISRLGADQTGRSRVGNHATRRIRIVSSNGF
jgi:hypothetical protein